MAAATTIVCLECAARLSVVATVEDVQAFSLTVICPRCGVRVKLDAPFPSLTPIVTIV
jgi:transcription elongation factor Elf1